MVSQRLKWFINAWMLITLQVAASAFSAESGPQTLGLISQEQQEIIAVIQIQLDAFRDNDGVTAFHQASPAIKRQLITAENFLEMVRYHYKAVFRPQQVTFLELEVAEPYRVQHLMLIGPRGYSWDAYYVMEQQSDGRWTIGGVHLVMRDELPV